MKNFEQMSAELKQFVDEQIAFATKESILNSNNRWKLIADSLMDYVCHIDSCILSLWEAGEPTPDGGYRRMYDGKWYRSSPVNETPKCDCGLDEIIRTYKKMQND